MGSLFWLCLPGRWKWLGLLGLVQAFGLPGWGLVRLLLVQLAAWRQRRAAAEIRLLVGLTVVLDRCHAAEWSGQDCAWALLIMLSLIFPWKNWRLLLGWLGLAWLGQAASDWYGWWGWLRPLPHSAEAGAWCWAICGPALGVCALLGASLGQRKLAAALLLLGLAPWPGAVASRTQTRHWLSRETYGSRARLKVSGRAVDLTELKGAERSEGRDWLLFSNNPERCVGSRGGTLLEAVTPPGRGRVLVSHINLGLPADLVLSCRPRQNAHLRVRSARDGALTDPGSLLLQTDWEEAEVSGPWEKRLKGLLLNGMLELECESEGEIEWRVSWGEGGPLLPLREGQSRGLYLSPDRELLLSGKPGVWHWQAPWLQTQRRSFLSGKLHPTSAREVCAANAGVFSQENSTPLSAREVCAANAGVFSQENSTLLGDYGACRTLVFDATQPGEVWLVARGGVLGSVDGRPGPLLAAGQSRCLLRYGPGRQRIPLWLPVNSFAPYSLVFR